jgi:hypothetical protein
VATSKVSELIPGSLKIDPVASDKPKLGRPKVERSKAKYPWFKFWPDSWLSDTELSSCSMAAQGVWINCLSMIHKEHQGGSITKSVAQFSRTLRISNRELLEAFDELSDSGTAEIHYIKVHPDTGELLVNNPVDKYTENIIKSNLSQLSGETGNKAFSNLVYVSVLSRRMVREQKARDYDRLRKRKLRGK